MSIIESNDLNEVVKTYTNKWKWFLICSIITIVFGLLFIRYSVPQYATKAKIQIVEDKNANPQLSVFKDLNFLGGGKNKVEDEIEILNSRSNFIDVSVELGLNVTVFELGNIKDSEMYRNIPFKLNFITPDSIIYRSKTEFQIDLVSETTFSFKEGKEGEFNSRSFGQNIKTRIGDVVFLPNLVEIKKYKGRKFLIKIDPLTMVAESYKKKVVITQSKEFSNILSMTLNDPIPERGKDVLDALIKTYNNNAIEDKKAIADKTSSFIEDRITDIYSNLSSVDQSAEDFKTGRGLTDIASQANLNLNIGAANQQELQRMSTQLDIATSMKDYVDTEDDYEVLPSNVGLADQSIATTTAKYNQLVLERKRLLKSSNEKNPIIVNLDQQLDGLKRNMRSSLNSMTNSLNLQVNNLSSQVSRLNSKIYSAPKNERALRDITRKQQTTESLYLYLLQKREESQITFASAAPKSKIIDQAYSISNLPVSPKKPIILLASLVLGLLIPFSVIYVYDLLDNKVHSKMGLEKIVRSVPVLAEIPAQGKRESKLVGENDRSVLAESLRILRTNLDYILKSKKGNGENNIIMITSSVPGEGKTFISSNLAMILANTKKRVLLIGADIRNPKIYTFYDGKDSKKDVVPDRKMRLGLTDYLYADSLTSKEIIISKEINGNNIDIIYSGKIPPNPTELLMSDRTKELFTEVSKKYDYIIVDTAPLIAVTDTLLISDYADQVIYVTKAGVTEKKVLDFPMKLREDGKLKNLAFIVNAVKSSDLGYGGKYGYGYGQAKKKWYAFN